MTVGGEDPRADEGGFSEGNFMTDSYLVEGRVICRGERAWDVAGPMMGEEDVQWATPLTAAESDRLNLVG